MPLRSDREKKGQAGSMCSHMLHEDEFRTKTKRFMLKKLLHHFPHIIFMGWRAIQVVWGIPTAA